MALRGNWPKKKLTPKIEWGKGGPLRYANR